MSKSKIMAVVIAAVVVVAGVGVAIPVLRNRLSSSTEETTTAVEESVTEISTEAQTQPEETETIQETVTNEKAKLLHSPTARLLQQSNPLERLFPALTKKQITAAAKAKQPNRLIKRQPIPEFGMLTPLTEALRTWSRKPFSATATTVRATISTPMTKTAGSTATATMRFMTRRRALP